MKRNSSKGLLLQWLLKALDEQLYYGLRWKDRLKKIFYILWTHKSAEQWSKNVLEPFEAWAAYKGKLKGKNEKQLKATFRCALNSKKELREISRDKDGRYWQFVEIDSMEKGNTIKQRRRKSSKLRTDSVSTDETVEKAIANDLATLRLNSNSEKVSRPVKLPSFESSYHFEPLTPPHQANEITYNFKEEFSGEDTSRKETYSSSSDLSDRLTPSISFHNAGNVFTGNVSSPPANGNEDYRTNYTPPPDHRRLTPPQKNHQIVSRDSSSYRFSTDVWQPNCWPIPTAEDDPNKLNHFFSSDVTGMYNSTNQELDSSSSNSMDFLEMDQYVPNVMNFNTSTAQGQNRNGQSVLVNKTEPVNELRVSEFQTMMLDEDCFLNYVDPEACERIMRELDIRLSSSS